MLWKITNHHQQSIKTQFKDLSQPTEMHLLVEEVNHLLFTEPEGNIAHLKSKVIIPRDLWINTHINPSRLASHWRSNHSYSSLNINRWINWKKLDKSQVYLWRVRNHGCRDLTSRLKLKQVFFWIHTKQGWKNIDHICLHAFVLHGGDVFETRRGHIPVERRLPDESKLLSSTQPWTLAKTNINGQTSFWKRSSWPPSPCSCSSYAPSTEIWCNSMSIEHHQRIVKNSSKLQDLTFAFLPLNTSHPGQAFFGSRFD